MIERKSRMRRDREPAVKAVFFRASSASSSRVTFRCVSGVGSL
jgi:hypothetical protein